MKNYLVFVLLLAILSSCRLIHPSQMFKTEKDFSYNEFKESAKEYTIQAFDKLDLKVYTNKGYKLINIENSGQPPQVSNINYLVDHEGYVKIPTLGRVLLLGKTIKEAEKYLEEQYVEFYQDPFVLINIINRRVIVFSDGSNKGQVIELKNENYTLIEALAESGGISNLGKSYKIKLLRGDLKNPEIYLFNIFNVKDMAKANFLLEANDIIYVETRPIYISRVMNEISPYLSLITTGLLLYTLFSK
ncbi:MAG: polysaccharide biosynthesis/export family protein [Bacteroidota bacterium]